MLEMYAYIYRIDDNIIYKGDIKKSLIVKLNFNKSNKKVMNMMESKTTLFPKIKYMLNHELYEKMQKHNSVNFVLNSK